MTYAESRSRCARRRSPASCARHAVGGRHAVGDRARLQASAAPRAIAKVAGSRRLAGVVARRLLETMILVGY